MSKEVVKYYENYREEDRITTNNARRVEYFAKTVDKWNTEQFKIWMEYHLSVCTEKFIIGMSNHVIIVGRRRAASSGIAGSVCLKNAVRDLDNSELRP